MEEIRLAGVQIPVHHGRVDLSGTALAAHAWFQEFMSWFQEAVDDERLLPDHERLFSACVGGPSVEKCTVFALWSPEYGCGCSLPLQVPPPMLRKLIPLLRYVRGDSVGPTSQPSAAFFTRLA